MEKRKDTHLDNNGYYTESELAEILSFIEEDEQVLDSSEVDTDKVATAWAQVRRKHLFGRQ